MRSSRSSRASKGYLCADRRASSELALGNDDLRVLSNLIVGMMVNTTEAILTAPRPDAERAAQRTAEQQIRLIIVGAANWRSRM